MFTCDWLCLADKEIMGWRREKRRQREVSFLEEIYCLIRPNRSQRFHTDADFAAVAAGARTNVTLPSFYRYLIYIFPPSSICLSISRFPFPAWLCHLSGPPGPPTSVHVEEIIDTTASLSWRPGPDNHSPITAYTIQARTPFSLGWQAVTTGKLAPTTRGLLQSHSGGAALHSASPVRLLKMWFLPHDQALCNCSVTIDRHFIWLLGVLTHESHPDDEACCQSCNLIL